MKKSHLKLLALTVFVAFIASILLLSLSQSSTPSQAQDFELPVIDSSGLTGSYIKLSDFKGKVILLEFAVEWCPHCQNMADVIAQINENFKNKGVVVITVMLNVNTDLNRTVNFLKTYKSNWLHLYDTRSAYKLYDVRGTPTYFIIDKNFKIVERIEGEVSYSELASKLQKYTS